MRIVGGRLKGRVLTAPSSRAIRPTSERLRESIFDILEHRFPGHIEGARVVDLFAGSGALAIEALSRGARFALFVDNGAEARRRHSGQCRSVGARRGDPHLARRRDQTRFGARPAGRSRSPFSTRPMGRVSPVRRWPRLSRAAGLSRTRSASSRKRRRPRSTRRRGSQASTSGLMVIRGSRSSRRADGDVIAPALSNRRDWANVRRTVRGQRRLGAQR